MPLLPGKRLHCVLEPMENSSGWILKYEHLNHLIPVLQGRRKTHKVFNGAYTIGPAFNCIQEEEHLTCKTSESLPIAPHRSHLKSILKHLKSAFRSSQGIMDISQEPLPSLSSCPVLAEVEANATRNHFRFTTTHPLFQEKTLGTLKISNTVVRSRPRVLTMTLFQGEGSSEKLRSKKPEWNPNVMLYQLDFGGRVCKDSIKNFQVEKDGALVSLAVN